MFVDGFFDWFTLMRDGGRSEKEDGDKKGNGTEKIKGTFYWKCHHHTSKQLKTTPSRSVNRFFGSDFLLLLLFLLVQFKETPGSWCWFTWFYVLLCKYARSRRRRKKNMKRSNRTSYCVACHPHCPISYLMKSTSWNGLNSIKKSQDNDWKAFITQHCW